MLSPAKRACRNSIPFNLDNSMQWSKVWNMLGGVSLVTGRNLRDGQVEIVSKNRAALIFRVLIILSWSFQWFWSFLGGCTLCALVKTPSRLRNEFLYGYLIQVFFGHAFLRCKKSMRGPSSSGQCKFGSIGGARSRGGCLSATF